MNGLKYGQEPPPPSKVIAVHLNYASRAAERGRVPSEPSYFLKPTSSLSRGGEIVQPLGTQLASYEGEVAVIIGAAVRDVSPDEAMAHIGWYAAANDFGVHDFRWADRGSHLLAKGQDGFTPLGNPLAADEVDPDAMRLRTQVNGETRQDTAGDELLFTFSTIIADLSRFITLLPGDIILAGTPAGTGRVGPGDVIDVTLDVPGRGVSRVSSKVAAATQPLRPYGAMPKITADADAFVSGKNPRRPVSLSVQALEALGTVSTATLTVQLNQRGLRSTFLPGLRPTRPDIRMVGYAHTLRYVALREDVRETVRGEGEDAQKRAVELTEAGDVLVVEARGVEDCGTIGDILAARVLARGGVGIVTDGGVRDTPGVVGLDIPTYYRTANASSLWTSHIPLEVDVPISCAGVLVVAGDVVVGDAEGAVILPAALAEEIAHDALQVESKEAFALDRIRAGETVRGIYPLSKGREHEYQAWLAQRRNEEV